MKLKLLVTACVLGLGFAAGSAKAADCALYLSQSYYNYGQPISVGQSYSYNVDIPRFIFPGPHWSTFDYDMNNLTVHFYGTGITPEGQGPGEAYPGTYPSGGFYNLGGFYNPGGYAGTYDRYAVIRWPQGTEYCRTNSISVTLL